jgi:hypothetical protein
VQIRPAHPGQELLKAWRARCGWLEDQFALGKAQVDGRVVLEADFLGERLGDPHGQAVSPTLNSGLHVVLQLGIYNEYTAVGAA